MLEAVLSQVKHWKNAEYFCKWVFSLQPHWFKIGYCVNFAFKRLYSLKVNKKFYFPKFLKVFTILKTNLFDLSCILQHKIYYCFSVVFWNVFRLSDGLCHVFHTILARWIIARPRRYFFANLFCFPRFLYRTRLRSRTISDFPRWRILALRTTFEHVRWGNFVSSHIRRFGLTFYRPRFALHHKMEN